ncbi:MAG TPA: BatD family protein [Verrucomicrobiae bacterium]|nr:BatD family protein [Verrucomicrobiae bacterium]
MKLNRFISRTVAVLFAAALVFLSAPADAASFTASLDRDSIMMGETATMSLAFEGGKANNLPTPEVPGLRIVQSGSAQNVSIINGQMTSTVTVTFSITPLRTGEFTIPALTADVNGQRLSTEPLRLAVQKPSAPSATTINTGSEVAFIKLALPHEKVYSGQTVIGRVELYLRDDVQNFGNFQFTGTPAEGFSVGKMIEGQRGRAQVGNRVYNVIPILLPLTAVKSGALTLGPFTASVVVVLPSQNQGGDQFIRQFFNQGEQRQVTLASDQITVQALPLPAENRPADFNGAIGNFSLNVTAGPTNLTVGDPVTMRVQISGRGALNAVTLPAQNAWRDFKTFPPTSSVTNSDQFGFQGIKTFEQIVTPLNSDVHELPPFTFSFFNPDDGTYHTLTQPATPLVVHSAGATPLPIIAGNKNSNAESPAPPQDILPIKENLGTLVPRRTPLITSPAFLAVQSLPVAAFLAAFIWRKRADSLANNPRLRRQRAVAQRVRDGLGDLHQYAAENKSDEFFATLFRLLQEQLGERLDCPASAITENVIEEHPVLRGASKTTLDDLRELFQLCNQARYAPVRGSGELNSVAARLEKTISELQEVKA